MKNYKDPIECLLDENCTDPIVMFDENDNPVKFEQVGLIPVDEVLYAILMPTDVEEEVYLVFEVDVENDSLNIVENEDILDRVFADLDELIRANNIDLDNL